MNPKIDLSFHPKPSEVSSYDKENPDKAYISGILSTYQPTFTVGMHSRKAKLNHYFKKSLPKNTL